MSCVIFYSEDDLFIGAGDPRMIKLTNDPNVFSYDVIAWGADEYSPKVKYCPINWRLDHIYGWYLEEETEGETRADVCKNWQLPKKTQLAVFIAPNVWHHY